MKYITHTQSETESLGFRLADALKAGDVILFTGELGAGKTAFTRGIARGLGYKGEVTSPTYTIVNEYRGGRLPLAHFDIYRIEGEEELYHTGFDDYLDGRWVLAVEWSEGLSRSGINSIIDVGIKKLGDEREITVEGCEGL